MQQPLKVETLVDLANLDKVYDLRYEILRKPIGLPRSSAIFSEDASPTTTHVVAKHDGDIIGCVSLLSSPAQNRMQLRGMAIQLEWQNRGVGTLLLRHVQSPSMAQFTVLWCNARQSAVGFYARNGWTTCGDYFDIPHLGRHIVMEWKAG
jgi:N-acetylglutamate synthase-like GNAT family acetyltransferase